MATVEYHTDITRTVMKTSQGCDKVPSWVVNRAQQREVDFTRIWGLEIRRGDLEAYEKVEATRARGSCRFSRNTLDLRYLEARYAFSERMPTSSELARLFLHPTDVSAHQRDLLQQTQVVAREGAQACRLDAVGEIWVLNEPPGNCRIYLCSPYRIFVGRGVEGTGYCQYMPEHWSRFVLVNVTAPVCLQVIGSIRDSDFSSSFLRQRPRPARGAEADLREYAAGLNSARHSIDRQHVGT